MPTLGYKDIGGVKFQSLSETCWRFGPKSRLGSKTAADADAVAAVAKQLAGHADGLWSLLHGFPTSSHMYRKLIPLLAKNFHVIAPDYIGFGYSDAPNVADLMAFLMSPAAKWLTGTSIRMDGGEIKGI